MPASRDKSQKIGFVFSNLYHLYRKGKAAAQASAPIPGDAASLLDVSAQGPLVFARPHASRPAAGVVIKTGELATTGELAQGLAPEVRSYNPTEFIGKRVARPPVLPASAAVVGLRENLKALNDLHSRLRFMLQELEDLVKE